MANILFLYDHRSDLAALSGGDWLVGLPLANLQRPEIYTVARSADADPESTIIHVDMPSPHDARAIVLGPSNLTTGYRRRIRAYADSARTTLMHDSGWSVGTARAPWNTLDWSDAAFWTGLPAWNDVERRLWLVYLLPDAVVSRYWTIEIDDADNPDGYVEFGRLLISRYWQPSINFAYQGNGLSFSDNSLQSSTLSGGKTVWRRVNPRTFQCSFDTLPEDELFRRAYDFQRISGFDGQVFLIPDPEDADFLDRRAFLATASRLDAISQNAFLRGTTAFEFREVI
jgi:hypothetical protein